MKSDGGIISSESATEYMDSKSCAIAILDIPGEDINIFALDIVQIICFLIQLTYC